VISLSATATRQKRCCAACRDRRQLVSVRLDVEGLGAYALDAAHVAGCGRPDDHVRDYVIN